MLDLLRNKSNAVYLTHSLPAEDGLALHPESKPALNSYFMGDERVNDLSEELRTFLCRIHLNLGGVRFCFQSKAMLKFRQLNSRQSYNLPAMFAPQLVA